MNKEFRTGQPVEARKEDDSNTVKVTGYAAVFDSETDIGGYYRERIESGAFAEAIKNDDVRFLINHTGLPLARTKSGTLKLTEDEHGLRMEAELDLNDPDVQAIVPKMERGDLNEMSFAFTPNVEEWDDTGEIPVRTLRDVNLYDVAIVTYPAYGDTEIGLRSLENFREQEKRNQHSDAEKIAIKMRMKLALSR